MYTPGHIARCHLPEEGTTIETIHRDCQQNVRGEAVENLSSSHLVDFEIQIRQDGKYLTGKVCCHCQCFCFCGEINSRSCD